MENDELKDFVERGLATDYLEVERHYFVFRTLGANADLINKANNDFRKKAVVYLQNSAMDLCILSITRIFDRKGIYATRCLEEVINRCSYQKSVYFPIELDYYLAISYLIDLTETGLLSDDLNQENSFTDFLLRVLKSEIVSRASKNVKDIRNKYIAHNEHLVDPLRIPSFWDDYYLLLKIARAYLMIIGSVFVSSHYISFQDPDSAEVEMSTYLQSHWIVELIESIVGRDAAEIPLT